LGKLVARRTQLQQYLLPQAVSALGAHVYAQRRFAEAFPNHFTEIDEAVSQQSQLAQAGVPESQSEDFAGKVKGAADGLFRRGKSASIGLKLKTLHRKLGEATYRQHGQHSGPEELVTAIENAETEIREVQQKIDELEAAGQGRVLTPRRLLVGGVVAAALVGFIGLLSILPYSAPSGTGRTAGLEGRSGDVSTPRILHEPYTHVLMPKVSASRTHTVSSEDFLDAFNNQLGRHDDVKDISLVSFITGRNGEPIEHYISKVKDGSVEREAYLYTDAVTGKLVLHGPARRFNEEGVLVLEWLFIWGTSKFVNAWTSDGRPKEWHIYHGDERHRMYSFRYHDMRTLSRMDTHRCINIDGTNRTERIRFAQDGLKIEFDEFGEVLRETIWGNLSPTNQPSESKVFGLRFPTGETWGVMEPVDPRDEIVLKRALETIRNSRQK
jgi:hypothetical protein